MPSEKSDRILFRESRTVIKDGKITSEPLPKNCQPASVSPERQQALDQHFDEFWRAAREKLSRERPELFSDPQG